MLDSSGVYLLAARQPCSRVVCSGLKDCRQTNSIRQRERTWRICGMECTLRLDRPWSYCRSESKPSPRSSGRKLPPPSSIEEDLPPNERQVEDRNATADSAQASMVRYVILYVYCRNACANSDEGSESVFLWICHPGSCRDVVAASLLKGSGSHLVVLLVCPGDGQSRT